MRVLIVGYGRMGRAVEAAAGARGHEVAAIVDVSARTKSIARSIDRRLLRRVDVAIEFTAPSAAEANVAVLLEAGVPVVCGTTGWAGADSTPVRNAARRGGVGAVIAPNFSVGMAFFYEAVELAAARYVASGLYDPWVVESHHRGKLDAPSGTARKLAALVAEASPDGADVVTGLDAGPVPPRAVHVGALRAGHEPGRHTVGFDGEHDVVTLTHAARGRTGFAFGAVVAAEWVRERRGIHGFDEVVRDLTRRKGRPGGRR